MRSVTLMLLLLLLQFCYRFLCEKNAGNLADEEAFCGTGG